jgi:hypothetical protein
MQCPQCQTDLDLGDVFCRRCGAPQSAATFRPSAPPIDRRAWRDPGPAPRTPPSLLMSDRDAMITFGLLFGGIFGFVGTVIGVSFTVVGLTGDPTFAIVGPLVWLVFGGIGYTVMGFAIRKVLRLRRLWQQGQVCEGSITQITRDRSIRVNGRSPLQVSYTWKDLMSNGEGSSHSWNMSLVELTPGARIAVLVSSELPGQSLPVLPEEAIGPLPRATAKI